MNLEIKKIFFNKKCIYRSYASLVEYVKMNPCNLLYQYAKEENAYDHMNWCRKSILQNLTSIHIKTLDTLGIEGSLHLLKNMYKILKANNWLPT